MDDCLKELERLLSEPSESVRDRERTTFDRELKECNGNVVLFGAGNLGRKSLACLRSMGVEPLAFSDNSPAKWGTTVDGVPVLSPEETAVKYGKTALFIVTIWTLGHMFSEGAAKLASLGCTKVICSSSLRWKFSERLLPDYCQDLPHKVYQQAEEVVRVASLWADEQSRREYVKHVRWRALGDLGAISPPSGEESYFLDSLYRIQPGEVFLDCGAYDGDTIRQLFKRSSDFDRILAVEADPATFQRLRTWVGSLGPEMSQKVELYNLAITSHPGTLRFNATGGEGAHLSTEGDVAVECARIDDVFKQHPPTFIKMDIEGAELDALCGAKNTIARLPLLSICVYHKQNDLWRIPIFIHDLAPDYKFFLRPHDVDGWQLVFYAVPTSRLIS